MSLQIYGDFELLFREHNTVFAYKRSGGGATAIILANFGDAETSVNLQGILDLKGATLELTNYLDHRASEALTDLSRVRLRGWEAVMYIVH